MNVSCFGSSTKIGEMRAVRRVGSLFHLRRRPYALSLLLTPRGVLYRWAEKRMKRFQAVSSFPPPRFCCAEKGVILMVAPAHGHVSLLHYENFPPFRTPFILRRSLSTLRTSLHHIPILFSWTLFGHILFRLEQSFQGRDPASLEHWMTSTP